MDYNELLKKYNLLFHENSRLREENSKLKAQLGLPTSGLPPSPSSATATKEKTLSNESTEGNCSAGVDSTSDSISKIRLFMSLFRGREDVYAKRWENKKKGTSGYSPVCLNQWQEGLCGKPRIPCAKCDHKAYAPLNEDTIEEHLRGKIIVGIYPMLSDETCCFLAMDPEGRFVPCCFSHCL
jgi:hypothetical protein